MKKIVVSGVQATGNLHIGNYLGAINNWLTIQDNYQCFFFLADLHSLTTDIDKKDFQNYILSTAAIYYASGLDPKKSIIFPQSLVPQHAELAWIFNCFTPIGWLNRMTQFKEKALKGLESANLGLFSYPVLMAADILLYKGEYVPVGKDQTQHLELARDIAGVINRKFHHQLLPLPENLNFNNYTKIMSLKDGTKKMSKSASSDLSRINLTDNDNEIDKKIKKAKTDTLEYLSYDPELRPEVSNLINIYGAFANLMPNQIIEKYKNNKNFSTFKSDLAEIIISKLSPIRTEYEKLVADPMYIKATLKEGAEKAIVHADKTLTEIKEYLGLI